LRAAIEELIVTDGTGDRIPITASLGVAAWRVGAGGPANVDRRLS